MRRRPLLGALGSLSVAGCLEVTPFSANGEYDAPITGVDFESRDPDDVDAGPRILGGDGNEAAIDVATEPPRVTVTSHVFVPSEACGDVVLESVAYDESDETLTVLVGTELDVGWIGRWLGAVCDDAQTARGYELTVDLESVPSRVVVRAGDSSGLIETTWERSNSRASAPRGVTLDTTSSSRASRRSRHTGR